MPDPVDNDVVMEVAEEVVPNSGAATEDAVDQCSVQVGGAEDAFGEEKVDGANAADGQVLFPVSYTHLTLPTTAIV